MGRTPVSCAFISLTQGIVSQAKSFPIVVAHTSRVVAEQQTCWCNSLARCSFFSLEGGWHRYSTNIGTYFVWWYCGTHLSATALETSACRGNRHDTRTGRSGQGVLCTWQNRQCMMSIQTRLDKLTRQKPRTSTPTQLDKGKGKGQTQRELQEQGSQQT